MTYVCMPLKFLQQAGVAVETPEWFGQARGEGHDSGRRSAKAFHVLA